MRRRRRFPGPLARALAAVLALAAGDAALSAQPAALLRDFRRAHGILVTRSGCLWLDLWFAESQAQRAQGLMFVRQLEEYEGMVFVSDPPVRANMWMKNTYVPLDMVFLDAGGRVIGVARDAKPLSEDLISTSGPVGVVLEVNAGFYDRHHLANGDRLQWVP